MSYESALSPESALALLRRPGFWRPTCALWKREMVRFVRQRSRVVGALLTPVLFWAMLGFGLNRNFVVPDASGQLDGGLGYLAYFFPGMLVMILLFTAIFSTISVIEDRREGFLQGVLVSPTPRLAIVMGKILGGATLATAQAALVMLLWPLLGAFPGWGAVLLALPVMFLIGMGLTGLGLALAWPMDSTAGFHAIMNVLLLPMWFLCGAVFPVATAPGWMQVVMYLNPLTYGHQVLTGLLHGAASPGLAIPRLLSTAIMLAAMAALVLLAAWVAGRPVRAGR